MFLFHYSYNLLMKMSTVIQVYWNGMEECLTGLLCEV